MHLAVVLWKVGEESVVLQCKLMRCINRDPLAAVKPVAMESVVGSRPVELHECRCIDAALV